MPVTNFFHTFVMSYLLVLNEFIFASLVLTYGRRYLKRQPSFFVMQPVYYPFLYLKYLWSSQLLLFEK